MADLDEGDDRDDRDPSSAVVIDACDSDNTAGGESNAGVKQPFVVIVSSDSDDEDDARACKYVVMDRVRFA